MNEAHFLSTVWMSEQNLEEAHVKATIDNALERDRALRERQRALRIGALLALMFLLPLLLWFAAHGVSPLVRLGYALMAAGAAVIVFSEWMYLEWSDRALPGPADTRAQLRTTAFMLARQAMLMKTAPVWSSPVFVGALLVGLWIYRERPPAAAFAVWTLTSAAWIAVWLGTRQVLRKLSQQRVLMEQLLNDLQ